MAGFEVTINGRFWVTAEGIGNHDLRDIAGIYQDGSGTHGSVRIRGKFGSIDVTAAT